MDTTSAQGPINGTKGKAALQKAIRGGEFTAHEDLAVFTKAAEEAGVSFDFSQLISLSANFMGGTDEYLVLSLKHFDKPEPTTILVLAGEKAFLYSKVPHRFESLQAFSRLLTKRYGVTTIIAFLVLQQAVANYESKLESLIGSARELDASFNPQRSRTISLELEQLMDRLEDLQAIMIKLEETHLKEVETRYISFDYGVLLAENNNLLDRGRRRLNVLKDLARDYEVQATTELNKRIERVNDAVKRLTALTVILMFPTLIASHFGMNFTHMPELRIAWVYPAVIISQVLMMVAGFITFRKIGWL